MLSEVDIATALAIAKSRGAIDTAILPEVGRIVHDVGDRGFVAVEEHALRLGDIQSGRPLVFDSGDLRAAMERVPHEQILVLERADDRIRKFAEAQRECLADLRLDVDGAVCGHNIVPLQRAGCYVPGGRYPLVSSMLMTAVTARAAGVKEVWAASPQPNDTMLAAAAVAGVDGLLACGGAQAIAALAYGADPIPTCDIVCGPGNNWVTAAKYIVSRDVRIDMLAGPSELVIVADESARPDWIAADLLAQAEHDPCAWPVLVTLYRPHLDAVRAQLDLQLVDLPSAPIARASLQSGLAVFVVDMHQAADLANQLAPEHLQLCINDAAARAHAFTTAGAIFLGHNTPEALGDYGIGPNHTLPTGGTARFASGLSVLSFLRMPTFVEANLNSQSESVMNDAVALARLEGMEAHARSLQARVI